MKCTFSIAVNMSSSAGGPGRARGQGQRAGAEGGVRQGVRCVSQKAGPGGMWWSGAYRCWRTSVGRCMDSTVPIPHPASCRYLQGTAWPGRQACHPATQPPTPTRAVVADAEHKVGRAALHGDVVQYPLHNLALAHALGEPRREAMGGGQTHKQAARVRGAGLGRDPKPCTPYSGQARHGPNFVIVFAGVTHTGRQAGRQAQLRAISHTARDPPA